MSSELFNGYRLPHCTTPNILIYFSLCNQVRTIKRQVFCDISSIFVFDLFYFFIWNYHLLFYFACRITLDTPMNRKNMPEADFSSWTPLQFVAE